MAVWKLALICLAVVIAGSLAAGLTCKTLGVPVACLIVGDFVVSTLGTYWVLMTFGTRR